jgi:cell division protease FtsH
MSTGAGNDIESATDLARRMVCEYGMSRLGPLTFGKKEEQIFLGREIAQHRDFSEETARQIDLEVRRLIDEAYQSAHALVESHADAMHRMGAALLERETIDAEEVRMLIMGETLPPMRSVLASPSDTGGGSPSRCSNPTPAAAPASRKAHPRPPSHLPAAGQPPAVVQTRLRRHQYGQNKRVIRFGEWPFYCLHGSTFGCPE